MEPLFLKYDNYIECRLCPHLCRIAEGRTGICGVRKNTGDSIGLTTYGVISGYSLDPVEKKPLYHFFPGTSILSIGSYGCNMRCDFCQNWHISRRSAEGNQSLMTPEKIADEALSHPGNLGIAYTYNEPVIWFEYIRDVALKIKERGLCNVLVSNGFVNPGPLNEIISFTDAFNIDLKAFTDEFYKKLTGAGIDPVKSALKQIAESGRHLEITTLVIPELNDSVEDMNAQSEWIAGELGADTPLHLSRYFPNYRRDDPPTPVEKLEILLEAASKHLNYVYTGNVTTSSGQKTRCRECGTTVTERSGYRTRLLNIDATGRCLKCGTTVYRYFQLTRKNGND